MYYFFITFILIFETFFCSTATALESGELSVFTKRRALKLLINHGYRWKQTGTLALDAEAKTREARSALLPHIKFYAREFGANVHPGELGLSSLGYSAVIVGTYGVNLEMSLIDLASSARLNAARENEKISASNIDQYRSDLITLMLYQYLNVQKFRSNLDVIAANITRDNELIRFAEQRLHSGMGVELDRTRAKGLLAKDQYRQIEIRSQWVKSCDELSATLGEEHLSCTLPPLKLELLPKKYLQSRDINKIIENRPDVKASRSMTVAADEMKKFAERESLPKFQLYGQMGSVGVAGQVFGVSGVFSGLGGVQIVFPIYDGGLNSGKAQAEKVKAIQAELQEKQVDLDAKFQISQSLSQLKDVQAVVSLSNQNIEIAKEELYFAKRKKQLGSASGLEMSNAHVNLANAYDMNIQGIYAYEMAKVLFFKSTGQINKYFELELKKDPHD